MNNLTVKAFGEFVEGLKFRPEILSFADDGENTTFTLSNLFHLRVFPAPNERIILVDGIQARVIALDSVNKTVTVDRVFLEANVFEVLPPNYYFGTLISTSNEIKNVDPRFKFPMIYLNEIIDERLQPDQSAIERISNIRIAFLDYYSNDWTRSEHYDNAIDPLTSLSKVVRKQLNKRGVLSVDGEILQRNIPKWGKMSPKGNTEKYFNEFLDAIEWNFNLTIAKCSNK